MSDTPRAAMAHDGPFPFAPTATLDVFVMGCFCDDGGRCRPIAQIVHGRAYAEGEGLITWYRPSNPMRNGSETLTDADSAQQEHALWKSWADMTE